MTGKMKKMMAMFVAVVISFFAVPNIPMQAVAGDEVSVVSVATGWGRSAAILKNGTLYFWGAEYGLKNSI